MNLSKFKYQPPVEIGTVRVHFYPLNPWSLVSWGTWLVGKVHGYDMSLVHCAVQTPDYYCHATYDGIELIVNRYWGVLKEMSSVYVDLVCDDGYGYPYHYGKVTAGALYRMVYGIPKLEGDMSCVWFVTDFVGYFKDRDAIITPCDLYEHLL